MVSFGLCLVPRTFTKIIKDVANVYVDSGINSQFHLDDWLIIGSTCQEASNMVHTGLEKAQVAGFRFNIPKPSLGPRQNLEWLGMLWNSRDMVFSLSDGNLRRVTPKL